MPALVPRAEHAFLTKSSLINNASTDRTGAVAAGDPGGARHRRSRARAWWWRASAGRQESRGDLLVYVDADCRAPLTWLERIEERFASDPDLLALSGNYRFYDWDWWGRDAAARL